MFKYVARVTFLYVSKVWTFGVVDPQTIAPYCSLLGNVFPNQTEEIKDCLIENSTWSFTIHRYVSRKRGVSTIFFVFQLWKIQYQEGRNDSRAVANLFGKRLMPLAMPRRGHLLNQQKG